MSRLSSRQQVRFKKSETPRILGYLTAIELFSGIDNAGNRDDMVRNCAHTLHNRVKRQIKYSSQPKLLITGGRDSRAIAAAAKTADYTGLVSTGGPPDSADFRIGKHTMDILGMQHTHSGNRVNIESIVDAEDLLLLWTDMSEGIETLRHALAYPDFFQRKRTFSDAYRQNFHGLGGEIARGFYYPRRSGLEGLNNHNLDYAHHIISRLANKNIALKQEARDIRDEILDGIDRELEDLKPTVAQWLDFYYWQNRCLHWGSDMLSVKSPTFHAWTPHMNLEYIRSAWQLSVEDKATSQFCEDIIDVLAPNLRQVSYDHEIHTPSKPALSNRLKTSIKKTIRGFLPGRAEADSYTNLHIAEQELWNRVVLHSHGPIWPKFIREKELKALINRQPDADVLWNLATIEQMYSNLI